MFTDDSAGLQRQCSLLIFGPVIVRWGEGGFPSLSASRGFVSTTEEATHSFKQSEEQDMDATLTQRSRF